MLLLLLAERHPLEDVACGADGFNWKDALALVLRGHPTSTALLQSLSSHELIAVNMYVCVAWEGIPIRVKYHRVMLETTKLCASNQPCHERALMAAVVCHRRISASHFLAARVCNTSHSTPPGSLTSCTPRRHPTGCSPRPSCRQRLQALQSQNLRSRSHHHLA